MTIPELIERLLDMMGRKANAKPRPYRALRNPCADGKTHRWEKKGDTVGGWRQCIKCRKIIDVVVHPSHMPDTQPQPEAAP